MITKFLFEIIDSLNNENNGKIYFFSTPHGFKQIGQINMIYDFSSNFAVPIGMGIYLGEEKFYDEIDVQNRLQIVIEEKWINEKVITAFNEYVNINKKNIIEFASGVCYILLDTECELGKEKEIIEIPLINIIDVFAINCIENEYGSYNLYDFKIKIETGFENIYRIIDVYGHFSDEVIEEIITNYFKNLLNEEFNNNENTKI